MDYLARHTAIRKLGGAWFLRAIVASADKVRFVIMYERRTAVDPHTGEEKIYHVEYLAVAQGHGKIADLPEDQDSELFDWVCYDENDPESPEVPEGMEIVTHKCSLYNLLSIATLGLMFSGVSDAKGSRRPSNRLALHTVAGSPAHSYFAHHDIKATCDIGICLNIKGIGTRHGCRATIGLSGAVMIVPPAGWPSEHFAIPISDFVSIWRLRRNGNHTLIDRETWDVLLAERLHMARMRDTHNASCGRALNVKVPRRADNDDGWEITFGHSGHFQRFTLNDGEVLADVFKNIKHQPELVGQTCDTSAEPYGTDTRGRPNCCKFCDGRHWMQYCPHKNGGDYDNFLKAPVPQVCPLPGVYWKPTDSTWLHGNICWKMFLPQFRFPDHEKLDRSAKSHQQQMYQWHYHKQSFHRYGYIDINGYPLARAPGTGAYKLRKQIERGEIPGVPAGAPNTKENPQGPRGFSTLAPAAPSSSAAASGANAPSSSAASAFNEDRTLPTSFMERAPAAPASTPPGPGVSLAAAPPQPPIEIVGDQRVRTLEGVTREFNDREILVERAIAEYSCGAHKYAPNDHPLAKKDHSLVPLFTNALKLHYRSIEYVKQDQENSKKLKQQAASQHRRVQESDVIPSAASASGANAPTPGIAARMRQVEALQAQKEDDCPDEAGSHSSASGSGSLTAERVKSHTSAHGGTVASHDGYSKHDDAASEADSDLSLSSDVSLGSLAGPGEQTTTKYRAALDYFCSQKVNLLSVDPNHLGKAQLDHWKDQVEGYLALDAERSWPMGHKYSRGGNPSEIEMLRWCLDTNDGHQYYPVYFASCLRDFTQCPNTYQRVGTGNDRHYTRAPGENMMMMALTDSQVDSVAKADTVLFNLDSGYPRTPELNKTQHARVLCIKHFQKLKKYASKLYAGSSAGSEAGSVLSMASRVSAGSLVSLALEPPRPGVPERPGTPAERPAAPPALPAALA